MMKKKGQMQQVFTYIMVIIIIGLILVVGYKSIGGLLVKGCDVEKSTFETNIKSFIGKYTSYGSYHKETLNAPCSSAHICFVDKDAVMNGDNISSENDVIDNSVKDKIQENIFLVKTEVTEPIGFLTEIKVDNNGEKFICIDNVNGKFSIAFEGLGKQTSISSGAS